MAPAGLALLAAPTRAAPQRFLPAVLGLPLVASSLVEVISFHRAFQPAIGFIGQGRIAQPPTPAIARPGMHTQLSSNTPRRARQAQQEGREHPVQDRALAAIQERAREGIAGALARLLFTAVAF